MAQNRAFGHFKRIALESVLFLVQFLESLRDFQLLLGATFGQNVCEGVSEIFGQMFGNVRSLSKDPQSLGRQLV